MTVVVTVGGCMGGDGADADADADADGGFEWECEWECLSVYVRVVRAGCSGGGAGVG